MKCAAAIAARVIKKSKAMAHRLQLRCPDCAFAEVAGAAEMLRRLQAAGMMRRAKEPDEAMIEELFVQTASRFACPQCGRLGLTVQETDDDGGDEAWGMSRRCARCRAPIPRERLDVFPEAKLCAACQQSSEANPADETPEYCPRCGSIMTLRSSTSRGVVRYVQRCPQCGAVE
jgi:predicted RNA-binding Zn-ribbon protein involved in translation (DUF1610 family)